MKRRRSLRAGPKVRHLLVGGPWQGHTIMLSPAERCSTATLVVSGLVGNYKSADSRHTYPVYHRGRYIQRALWVPKEKK